MLILGDAHLAKDAAQDTLLKAWKGLNGYQGQASEKTWLTTIAVNVCRDYRRLNWFRRRADEETLLEQIPAPPTSEPQDDLILRAVLHLQSRYREPILLYYWQEYIIREIAQITGEKENTISTCLRRARKQLEEELKGVFDGTALERIP